MKVDYTNVYTFFIPENQKDKEILEELSKNVVIRKLEYNPILKRKEIKYVTLLQKNRNNTYYILSGLLPYLKMKYPKIHTSLIDTEKLKKDPIWQILRDYQKRAILNLLEQPRGIIDAIMGSGKTYMIMAICKAIKENIPILVIIPKYQALLEQTVKKFLEFFKKYEIGWNYGKGYKNGRIMISSSTCLEKLPLNYYKAVAVDEAHSCPANTIKKALLKCKNAIIRYGFSGTPIGRSDQNDYITIGLLGNIIEKVTYQELKEKGFTSPVKYFILKYNSTDFYDRDLFLYSDTKEWHKVVEKFILENKTRTKIILELLKHIINSNRNCLIVVERKEHGKKLEKEIKESFDENIVRYISSDTKHNFRTIQEFNSGKFKILIATQLIEIGMDIPNLNTIIIASIGKSSIQLLQRIGRGLRLQEGKLLLVFDFQDGDNNVLYHHSYQRKKWLMQKGFSYEEVILYRDIEKEIERLWFGKCQNQMINY